MYKMDLFRRYLNYYYKRLWWSYNVRKQRRYRRSTSEPEYYTDPFKPKDGNYEVDPRSIRFIYSQSTVPLRKFDCGLIMDGDWASDSEAQLIEKSPLYKAAFQRFKEGKEWSETRYYREFINNNMERTIGTKHKQDLESKLKKQLKAREKLYLKMQKEGYLPQNRIIEEMPNAKALQHWGEIAIHIGRNGELYLSQGRHRATYARLLGLDKVYVNIIVRHADWVRFRNRIISWAMKNGGKIETPQPHVDLRYIPSHYQDIRFKLISAELDTKEGCILDLNAHWGYFSRVFENHGFKCFAYEGSKEDLEFLIKLRQVNDSKFSIVENMHCDDLFKHGPYVAALLMGSWTKSVNDRQSYENLIHLFSKQDIRYLFVELKKEVVEEDFSGTQLVEDMLRSSIFSTKKLIGHTEMETELYKLNHGS